MKNIITLFTMLWQNIYKHHLYFTIYKNPLEFIQPKWIKIYSIKMKDDGDEAKVDVAKDEGEEK